MERYRVSLIFAAADIDTYGCIKAFAKNTTRATRTAFEYVLHRARIRAVWDALRVTHSKGALENALALRMGRYGKPAGNNNNEISTEGKSEHELKNMYMDAVKAVGRSVDPNIFMSDSEVHTDTETDHNKV